MQKRARNVREGGAPMRACLLSFFFFFFCNTQREPLEGESDVLLFESLAQARLVWFEPKFSGLSTTTSYMS